MIIGAFLLRAGLVWFSWTSDPNVSWVAQGPRRHPYQCWRADDFMPELNYIIDCYLMYANSTITVITLVRSLAGAGFPLFAMPMYNCLGVDWATGLLGFLTVAMIPVLVPFFLYGGRIRSLS